jgi:hypothetical protein
MYNSAIMKIPMIARQQHNIQSFDGLEPFLRRLYNALVIMQVHPHCEIHAFWSSRLNIWLAGKREKRSIECG